MERLPGFGEAVPKTWNASHVLVLHSRKHGTASRFWGSRAQNLERLPCFGLAFPKTWNGFQVLGKPCPKLGPPPMFWSCVPENMDELLSFGKAVTKKGPASTSFRSTIP